MSEALRQLWTAAAQEPFEGWSFGEMAIDEESPPWSYPTLALRVLDGASVALDVATGGGEMLAQLAAAWPKVMVATEGWSPNVTVAAAKLLPLGASVVECLDGTGATFPFRAAAFDVVLARHAFCEPTEIARLLRRGGWFVTQQVGPNNLDELRVAFGRPPEDGTTYTQWRDKALDAGLRIIESSQWEGTSTFRDVEAVVKFLRAVPWQVPRFDVDGDFDVLLSLHRKHLDGNPLVFRGVRRWYAIAQR